MMKEVERKANELTEIVGYFKQCHVRVVNMSWGLPQSWIESLLKGAKPQLTPDALKRQASNVYEALKRGLYHAIQSAHGILFVASAGNEGIDISKQERPPATFQLPNLFSVGMVNKGGRYAGGNYGKVEVYAWGEDRKALMPDGRRISWSGTSLAAPEVTNLAGKLLAVCPKLTAQELRSLILNGADQRELDTAKQGKLLHPKKSLKLLERHHCRVSGKRVKAGSLGIDTK
jgi:subtilisin family serine protease